MTYDWRFSNHVVDEALGADFVGRFGISRGLSASYGGHLAVNR